MTCHSFLVSFVSRRIAVTRRSGVHIDLHESLDYQETERKTAKMVEIKYAPRFGRREQQNTKSHGRLELSKIDGKKLQFQNRDIKYYVK